ncbi:hypothetical protein CAL26_05155 [Bordetella genomosp. 9]|uniref:Uncharacterized protein n=1 Tax=Bordetella genomosp. 9 TaxID=1416803 RepID=A0A261RP76_9BORD|nr:hypothetical protein [Bordetella genomosp. 9]OZI26711.1 hypothetical protein CAL26_05155 [Bordetella genomosp. 9]
MAGRILTAETRKVTRFHELEEGFAIETVADVEPELEFAKALHNEGFHRTASGDRHVASIPAVVLNAWAIKRGVTFDAVMQDNRILKEFLNDPDHSHFRVDKGQV